MQPNQDDEPNWWFWIKLIGHGLLLIVRWPFTPLWKSRDFDFEGPYQIPKTEIPYHLLCGFSVFVEVMLPALVLSRLFDTIPAPTWTIFVSASIFIVLTGVRIYMYGRDESTAWTW